MGLSIYYRLRTKVDADGARGLVRCLHEFAGTLPFDRISPIIELDPPDGKFEFARGEGEEGRFKPGSRYLTRKREDGLTESVRVPALHVVCFSNDRERRGDGAVRAGIASGGRRSPGGRGILPAGMQRAS